MSEESSRDANTTLSKFPHVWSEFCRNSSTASPDLGSNACSMADEHTSNNNGKDQLVKSPIVTDNGDTSLSTKAEAKEEQIADSTSRPGLIEES